MGIFRSWLQREIDTIEETSGSVDWAAVQAGEISLTSAGGATIESDGDNSGIRLDALGENGTVFISATAPGGAINLEADQGMALVADGAGSITLVVPGGGQFQMNGTGIGFNGAGPVAQPTGVAVTAEAVHAALVSLGLITA